MTQRERIAALEARVDDLVKLVATLVEENVALRADMAANLLMGKQPTAWPGFPNLPAPAPYPFSPVPPPPPMYPVGPSVWPPVQPLRWEITSFPTVMSTGSAGPMTIQSQR